VPGEKIFNQLEKLRCRFVSPVRERRLEFPSLAKPCTKSIADMLTSSKSKVQRA
jgi:hypothetical protein